MALRNGFPAPFLTLPIGDREGRRDSCWRSFCSPGTRPAGTFGLTLADRIDHDGVNDARRVVYKTVMFEGLDVPGGGLGIGGHTRAYRGQKDEWLTPPEIIRAMGPFDLDPCAPVCRPWPTASLHYTIQDDGLSQPWFGRVWCNPPYGPETGRRLGRLAEHGTGTALIFARTETEMFFQHVWRRADAVLFIEGRLHFYDVEGRRAQGNAGGPSVLVAYGVEDVERLATLGLGQFLDLRGVNRYRGPVEQPGLFG